VRRELKCACIKTSVCKMCGGLIFFIFDFRHINAVGVGLGPAGEWFEARVGEKSEKVREWSLC